MRLIMRAVSCCVLLVTGCVLCWGQNSVNPVEVALCNLYQHPKEYAGKMVRVRGSSVSDLHIQDTLHDSPAVSCPAYMRIVVVFPDQVKHAPGFQLIRDDSYKKLYEALHSKGPIHIDATYEGRFDPVFVWREHKRIKVAEGNETGYGKRHEYDGRIVLRQVSDVWAKPLPRK
ncbi:MAG TPA: hypothetical protein VFP59_12475 [Candidatus Angelobacter sp.]|nr:hypothetical protein [Candidatus Angelobacter sp.]